MNDFRIDSDKQVEAIRQFGEWRKVADLYDQILPRITEDLIDSSDADQVADKSLRVAAGLKTAVIASYNAGRPRDRYPEATLRIDGATFSDSKTVPTFFANLESGDGTYGPAWTRLKGSALSMPVQAIGKMVGSEILQGQATTWNLNVKSGGDSLPYVRARFEPSVSDLPELGLYASYHYMRRGTPTTEIQVDDLWMPREEVDPEIVKATLAFAGAVTQWITNPDSGAIRTWHTAEHS